MLINVPNRVTMMHDIGQKSLWHQRFDKLIPQVSSTVAEIKTGQWIHTSKARAFLGECLSITNTMFGSSLKWDRLCECWSRAIITAQKVYFLLHIYRSYVLSQACHYIPCLTTAFGVG